MVKRLRMFTFMLVWLVFPSVIFTDTSAQRKTKEGLLEMESEGKRSLSAMITYNSSERFFTRLDRANDGASRQEGTDYLMSTVPNLSRAQASRQLTRVVLPKCHEVGLLKKTVQKVQETTSDRMQSACHNSFTGIWLLIMNTRP